MAVAYGFADVTAETLNESHAASWLAGMSSRVAVSGVSVLKH